MQSGRPRSKEQDDADLCANLSKIYLNNLSDAERNLFLAGLAVNIFSSIITVIMNSMIIHILMNASQAHDIVHPILCSICGAGLFSGIVVQPLLAINCYLDSKVFQYIWPCHKISGIFFAAAYHLTGYSVLASLALLSFYHLQAVSDPARFRTRYTIKRSRKHVVYLWVSEVIIAFGSQGIFWQDNRNADIVFHAGACLLVLTIIVIQVWTVLLLKIHNRNMLNPETDSLEIALVVKRAQKMSKTSAMISAALIILCLPVVIVAVIIVNARRDRLAQKLSNQRDTTLKTLLLNTKILTFLFPAVYPLILLFMNKTFAKEAAKIFKSFNLCKRRSGTADITVHPAGQVTHSRAWTNPKQNENVSLEVPNDDVLRRRVQISSESNQRKKGSPFDEA